MRKIGHLLGALLAFGFCACQTLLEDDAFLVPKGSTVLTATIESGSSTRTSLSPEGEGRYKVIWNENDVIGIFVDDAPDVSIYSLTTGAGTSKGSFAGYGMGSRYVAAYPTEMVASLEGDELTFDFPEEQTYVDGSFCEGVLPMVAVSVSTNLTFKNVASILKLSLKGHQSITRLVFRSHNPADKASGPMTVSLHDPDNPVTTMSADGVDSVAVNTGGVLLDPDVETAFYIAVPAQKYKGGFSVRIYTSTGYMDKTYKSDFTMERSKVHPAGVITVKLDSGVEVSETLEGRGTEKDPLRITSLGDLLLMQSTVNAGGSVRTSGGESIDAMTAFYFLVNDIDLSPVYNEKSGKSWTPIGNDSHRFSGSFEGDGHMIKGLYINTDLSDQGLFGVLDAGSRINNLTVVGNVTSTGEYIGLVAGRFENMDGSWTFMNCSSEGTLRGGNQVGGILGGGSSVLEYGCVNRADITGQYYVGGIAGRTSWGGSNCINYGTITGVNMTGGIFGTSGDMIEACSNFGTIKGGQKTGGIIGYQNYGWLSNCLNEGEVSGSSEVGGISAYSRQGSAVWNNVNRGHVSGNDIVGGVCGWLSSNSGSSILQNCLNLGEVELLKSGGHAGGICGRNEGPYEYSGAGPCTLEQSYWLYDKTKGVGMETGIGLDDGTSGNNYSLSIAQMKGASYGSALYQGYSVILDALNCWAYDQRNRRELQSWQYSAVDGYPVLTGLPVQSPGGDQTVFTISMNNTEILASGGVFTVDVKSSEQYTVETPGWISESSVQTFETDRYLKRHTFSVSRNDSGANRSGSVAFTNSKGTKLTVHVSQKYPYLRLDDSDIVFSANVSSRRISLESSLPWTASSGATWCTVAPSSGDGNGAVTVKAMLNDDSSLRETYITIASEDKSIQYTIHVIQSGSKPQEEGDWKKLEFVHQSLMMRFTATWCGYCPTMNTSVKMAQEKYPDKIQHLALHGGGSDLQFSDVTPLMNRYSITGFPTGIVDGRSLIENYSSDYASDLIVNAVKETESVYGTRTGVDISTSVSGRSVNVDVNAYVKKAGDYKITVLLVEDDIVKSQSDYYNGTQGKYLHDSVARMSLTDVDGDSFTISGDYKVKSFHYSASVPAAYVMDNMRVLVYIQRTFGSDPVYQSGSYGDYFVDNVGTAPVGGYLKLALESGGGGAGGGDNEGITPGDDINL